MFPNFLPEDVFLDVFVISVVVFVFVKSSFLPANLDEFENRGRMFLFLCERRGEITRVGRTYNPDNSRRREKLIDFD